MKITTRQLRRIIREEASRLREVGGRPRRQQRSKGGSSVERLRKLAASIDYKLEAPYSWGYDEQGVEQEDGAVKFDAAITDDYGDWIVGLKGDQIDLHTTDDDVMMTLDQFAALIKDNDVGDLIEMSTDEINELLADL